MVGLCFLYTSNNSYQNQWDYIISHFPIDNIWILKAPIDKPLPTYYKDAQNIDCISRLPENIPVILLAAKESRYVHGITSLVEFKHPKDATYLFGSDTENISEDFFINRQPDNIVYIPTKTHYEMYSHVAASITFYDRLVKNG